MSNYSEKIQNQLIMFANRLTKRSQYLKKWAKRLNITAYRLYDRDIPEIPLCVDYYEFVDQNTDTDAQRFAYVSMFERPYEKDEREEEMWLDAMVAEIERTLSLLPGHVLVKTRKRQRGSDQYEKMKTPKSVKGIVREDSRLYLVNLSDYLDTGLFLDHRSLRHLLGKIAKNKDVLNLFAYTGSLSVAAAMGGARYVQTVDLSNTYLAWARQNLQLNGFTDEKAFPTVRSDVMDFLQTESFKLKNNARGRQYDIILLDPPTFSNSKKTEGVLDTNRDWPELVKACLGLLRPGGELFFSTNSRRLAFSADRIPDAVNGHRVTVEDITDKTIPEDFKAHRIHRCWKMSLLPNTAE